MLNMLGVCGAGRRRPGAVPPGLHHRPRRRHGAPRHPVRGGPGGRGASRAGARALGRRVRQYVGEFRSRNDTTARFMRPSGIGAPWMVRYAVRCRRAPATATWWGSRFVSRTTAGRSRGLSCRPVRAHGGAPARCITLVGSTGGCLVVWLLLALPSVAAAHGMLLRAHPAALIPRVDPASRNHSSDFQRARGEPLQPRHPAPRPDRDCRNRRACTAGDRIDDGHGRRTGHHPGTRRPPAGSLAGRPLFDPAGGSSPSILTALPADFTLTYTTVGASRLETVASHRVGVPGQAIARHVRNYQVPVLKPETAPPVWGRPSPAIPASGRSR